MKTGKEKTIEALRKFFIISNAAFNFQGVILSAIGKQYNPSPMHLLHEVAQVEINKEKPDMNFMDSLLLEMEELAGKNKTK